MRMCVGGRKEEVLFDRVTHFSRASFLHHHRMLRLVRGLGCPSPAAGIVLVTTETVRGQVQCAPSRPRVCVWSQLNPAIPQTHKYRATCSSSTRSGAAFSPASTSGGTTSRPSHRCPGTCPPSSRTTHPPPPLPPPRPLMGLLLLARRRRRNGPRRCTAPRARPWPRPSPHGRRRRRR